MYRQYKRRIKRKWDKIPCFVECSRLVKLDFMPYSIYTYGIKCNSSLFVLIEVDRFMRWFIHVFSVFDGFMREKALYSYVIGDVSDDWLWSLDDDELVDELYENYAYRKMR